MFFVSMIMHDAFLSRKGKVSLSRQHSTTLQHHVSAQPVNNIFSFSHQDYIFTLPHSSMKVYDWTKWFKASKLYL